jgi:ATP-binding cassette, subfamily C, bacterial CydC
MIRKLLRFAMQHKLQFAGALLLATATILTGIGLMSSSGYLISRAAQRPMLVDLFMVTAAVRFFGISRAVVRYFERVVSHDLTFRILSDMRSLLYRKLDSLSLDWLMGRKSGDLLARLVSDIETLQHAYLRIISPAITAFVISIFTCAGLWFFDPSLALSTLGFLALSGIVVPLLAIRLAKGTGSKDVSLKSGLKAYLVDRLQGLQELIWLGQKQKTAEDVVAMQQEINTLHHKNAGISGLLEGLHSLSAHLGMFAVLALSIPLVLAGNIPGVMLAMLTLGVLSSFEAVQNLGNAFQHFATYREASSRMHFVTESNEAIVEPKLVREITKQHNLIFKDISFSYEAEFITLQDVNFEIGQHSKTAIVGPTGSGKSTLVNLMLRFWDPQAGSIMLHGTDIRNFDQEELRSKFAVVSQDAYIFNNSLRENLLIANPSATDLQLKEALEKAGLASFATNLELPLGNHGMRLSGGERRLLALARARLKDAPIWIFDEPTANLDVKTERKILDAIWATAGQHTMIMITHRLLDMEKMDQIIVMNRGQVVEKGTHSQLLAGQSLYAKMVGYQIDFR